MQRFGVPRAGSRARTYLQLVVIGSIPLLVGLLLPFVAGDSISETALSSGDTELPDLSAEDVETGVTDGDTDTGLATDPDGAALGEGAATGDLAGGDAGLSGPGGTGGTAGASGASGASAGPATNGSSAGPAGAGGTQRPSAPLTASDVGVTPTTVRLGFLILDLGPIGQAGYPLVVDPEQQERAIGAFVKEINENGGVVGRKIEPYYARFDVLDQSGDSARRACQYLTRDVKVFAVLGGFSAPSDALCVLEQAKTPMISYIGYHPDELYRRSGGLLVTSFPTATRMMANFVHELERLKIIPGRKLGIVADDRSDPGFVTTATIERMLRSNGHEIVRISRLSGSASSQVPVEVQQQRTAGTEVVLMLAATLNAQQFTQVATQQNWDPIWATSDWATGTGDSTYSNAGRAFDGAIGITSTRNHEFRGNVPEPRVARECIEIYERQTKTKAKQRGDTAERSITHHFCDMLRIFRLGAENHGANLTRPGLIAGVERIGAFAQSTTADGSFRPGKRDAADFVRTIRWSFDCKCWNYVDGFRPMRFR